MHDNIAYGMKLRKSKHDEIQSKVSELLELVGLPADLEAVFLLSSSGRAAAEWRLPGHWRRNRRCSCWMSLLRAIDAKVRKELRHWLKDMIEAKVGITQCIGYGYGPGGSGIKKVRG